MLITQEKIKPQTVYTGDFPLMTENGTFIINGTERCCVTACTFTGVYFEKIADKTTDKDYYSAKIIPSRGAWLELEQHKRETVSIRIDPVNVSNLPHYFCVLWV